MLISAINRTWICISGPVKRKWGILFTPCGFLLATNRRNKGWGKWLGKGVIIGRFVNKYALVHFRWSYLEVDVGDMRSENRLLEILGRDGA